MSNINIKHNNIFVHVPKTAGTSMEIHDFVGGNSHASAKVLRQIVGEKKWEEMFTWGFVRNPLDRFVSAFFHEPRTHSFQRNNKGFREFVYFMGRMGIDIEGSINGAGHHHHHFVPQHYFLCDYAPDKLGYKVIVDFVGNFSTLREDWADVCNKIGVGFPQELTHERKSNHAHYSSYYAGDPALVEIVKELYKDDYQTFGDLLSIGEEML